MIGQIFRLLYILSTDLVENIASSSSSIVCVCVHCRGHMFICNLFRLQFCGLSGVTTYMQYNERRFIIDSKYVKYETRGMAI
jgi:hypothetical protein